MKKVKDNFKVLWWAIRLAYRISPKTFLFWLFLSIVLCCSSNYLRLHVALYLQLFSRLSRMQHHIIQARLGTLNTVIQKRSTLFNPNEIAGSKNIRVFCNILLITFILVIVFLYCNKCVCDTDGIYRLKPRMLF